METTMNDHGLSSIGACGEAKEFAAKYESLQAAWEACDNPEWLLWLLLRTAGEWGSESHRRAVGVLVECVRPAMQYVPAGETRPQAAMDLLSRYARGEAVDRAAAWAASAAAWAAARAASAASAAAWAATRAASAAWAAASDAAWAASAAARAAARAASAAARAASAASGAAWAAASGAAWAAASDAAWAASDAARAASGAAWAAAKQAMVETIRRLVPAVPEIAR